MMADQLEVMGFPRDWCDMALLHRPRMEDAVDLLLEWKACGGPPRVLSPSFLLSPSSLHHSCVSPSPGTARRASDFVVAPGGEEIPAGSTSSPSAGGAANEVEGMQSCQEGALEGRQGNTEDTASTLFSSLASAHGALPADEREGERHRRCLNTLKAKWEQKEGSERQRRLSHHDAGDERRRRFEVGIGGGPLSDGGGGLESSGLAGDGDDDESVKPKVMGGPAETPILRKYGRQPLVERETDRRRRRIQEENDESRRRDAVEGGGVATREGESSGGVESNDGCVGRRSGLGLNNYDDDGWGASVDSDALFGFPPLPRGEKRQGNSAGKEVSEFQRWGGGKMPCSSDVDDALAFPPLPHGRSGSPEFQWPGGRKMHTQSSNVNNGIAAAYHPHQPPHVNSRQGVPQNPNADSTVVHPQLFCGNSRCDNSLGSGSSGSGLQTAGGGNTMLQNPPEGNSTAAFHTLPRGDHTQGNGGRSGSSGSGSKMMGVSASCRLPPPPPPPLEDAEPVALRIRCPEGVTISATFRADSNLREVREVVMRRLLPRSRGEVGGGGGGPGSGSGGSSLSPRSGGGSILGDWEKWRRAERDVYSMLAREVVRNNLDGRHGGRGRGRMPRRLMPFTGTSFSISRQQHEGNPDLERHIAETARIMAEAVSMRGNLGGRREGADGQNGRVRNAAPVLEGGEEEEEEVVYFLMPFPKREFFTEESLSVTLREADLVPRGNIIVTMRRRAMGRGEEQEEKVANGLGGYTMDALSAPGFDGSRNAPLAGGRGTGNGDLDYGFLRPGGRERQEERRLGSWTGGRGGGFHARMAHHMATAAAATAHLTTAPPTSEVGGSSTAPCARHAEEVESDSVGQCGTKHVEGGRHDSMENITDGSLERCKRTCGAAGGGWAQPVHSRQRPWDLNGGGEEPETSGRADLVEASMAGMGIPNSYRMQELQRTGCRPYPCWDQQNMGGEGAGRGGGVQGGGLVESQATGGPSRFPMQGTMRTSRRPCTSWNEQNMEGGGGRGGEGVRGGGGGRGRGLVDERREQLRRRSMEAAQARLSGTMRDRGECAGKETGGSVGVGNGRDGSHEKRVETMEQLERQCGHLVNVRQSGEDKQEEGASGGGPVATEGFPERGVEEVPPDFRTRLETMRRLTEASAEEGDRRGRPQGANLRIDSSRSSSSTTYSRNTRERLWASAQGHNDFGFFSSSSFWAREARTQRHSAAARSAGELHDGESTAMPNERNHRGVAEGADRDGPGIGRHGAAQASRPQREGIREVPIEGHHSTSRPRSQEQQQDDVLQSDLSIRLEDGTVLRHSFPALASLEMVRNSVVPDGEDITAFGLIIPSQDGAYFDEEALRKTLREAGLVPRGTVHLCHVSNRGVVRRGTRPPFHSPAYRVSSTGPSLSSGPSWPAAHRRGGLRVRVRHSPRFGEDAFTAEMGPRLAAGGGRRRGEEELDFDWWGSDRESGEREEEAGRPGAWSDANDILFDLLENGFRGEAIGSGGGGGGGGRGSPDMSYEDMVALEESLGRVSVGVPEAKLSQMPKWIFKDKRNGKKDGEGKPISAKGKETCLGDDDDGGNRDVCIICMYEYNDGEEVVTLPCWHVYHADCIFKWLRQSKLCPTCKGSVV